MLLHVVRETDTGIVVRGAKFETAAAYSNQAFVKPTIANWGDALVKFRYTEPTDDLKAAAAVQRDPEIKPYKEFCGLLGLEKDAAGERLATLDAPDP